jgi:hypothetical protein
MKKFYFISLLSTIFLYGCRSQFSKFNDDALAFATNDKHIDQKEYESLVEQINLSDDKGFEQFKDDKGKIDNAKVVSYLLKYLKAKKNELTKPDIWQPEQQIALGDLFNINVYLENSASMDGYVKGVTEFETAIYNLLGDFKISRVCDSLNLNYINKSIPYTKKNALSADIQDFIEKLEPSTFRQRGGDRSVSDLSNILTSVLKTVNDKNVAVLISDFVFSPGANANAQDFLNNQGVGIKISFAEKLKVFDLSAVVIQLQSNFDGLYYDKTDKPIQINCKRPYYIWIIGNTKQISEILGKKILDNIKGGYQNRLVLQSIKGVTEPNIKIQSKTTFGSFDRAEIGNKIISDATESKDPNTKGLFGFNVAVDFGSSMQDGNFYTDTANYKFSNVNYHLKIEPINTNNSDASLSGFTHLLKLQTTSLRDESLRIDVIGCTPSWVYSSTSIDDSNIARDVYEKQKTFGFKFLMEGVSDAFYPKTNSSNSISSIKITIKK